jgi:hypothetical protein
LRLQASHDKAKALTGYAKVIIFNMITKRPYTSFTFFPFSQEIAVTGC